MLARILLFIVEVAADFLAAALLARFALQWARASFRNPVGQFVIAVTDWAVLPARRMIPGLFGLDLASCLLAWLVQLALSRAGLRACCRWARLGGSPDILALLFAAVIAVLRLSVYLAMLVVLVTALLSWINPHAPLAPVLSAARATLLAPFQRVIPPLGGIDLSPLVLLLLLQVVLMVLGSLGGTAFGVRM